MRYYIIAGEVSGDLHASFLMQEIKRDDPGAEFRFWGGDLMKKTILFIVVIVCWLCSNQYYD